MLWCQQRDPQQQLVRYITGQMPHEIGEDGTAEYYDPDVAEHDNDMKVKLLQILVKVGSNLTRKEAAAKEAELTEKQAKKAAKWAKNPRNPSNQGKRGKRSGGGDKGKAEGPSAKQAKPSKDKKSKSSTDGAGTGAQGGQHQPPKPNKDNGTGRKRYLSDSELSSEKVPKKPDFFNTELIFRSQKYTLK